MKLYKFYYKNTNNLLPSYFSSFTPFYENHSHNLRYNILRFLRETPKDDLNRCTQLNIIQFSAYFKNILLSIITMHCVI